MLGLTHTPEGSYQHPQDPGEFAYGTAAPRMSVSDEEAAILGWLASGRDVLEIGTGLGVSTRAMARTAKSLTTVDNDSWVQANVWPTVNWANHVHTLTELRPGASPVPMFFDLIFVDGDHRKEGLARDIELSSSVAKPHSSGGCLVVFHDVNYPHVGDVVRAACSSMRTIDTVHGLGLVWAIDLL